MAGMPWKNGSVEEQRRVLALQMLRRSKAVALICREFGVSRQTAYKWCGRFERQGVNGLVERQRGRPKNRSGGIDLWLKRVLVARRRRPSWGSCKLRWWLEQRHPERPLPSVRSIQRWLLASGRIRPRRRRLRAGHGLGPPVVALAPNDLWTIDFKGSFKTGDGARVQPLTIRDAHSRFILSVQPVPATSEALVKRVLVRLFRQFGLPRAIRTDRGSPFCGSGPYGLTALSLWWTRLGITVQFTRRRRGIDNNAHEQMHRILKAEVASPSASTYGAQLRRLQRWRQHYNHARPHDGLQGQTPADLYRAASRQPPALSAPRYPSTWITRRVRPHGFVKLRGSYRHIGRAFVGLVVGFNPSGQTYHVYFDHLLLGTLDPNIVRSGLIPVPSPK